jgi:hypothetical protein
MHNIDEDLVNGWEERDVDLTVALLISGNLRLPSTSFFGSRDMTMGICCLKDTYISSAILVNLVG